jgi:hypothetical protein
VRAAKSVPQPQLQELVDDWTVEVAIDDTFVQSYRSSDPKKIIRFRFPVEPGKVTSWDGRAVHVKALGRQRWTLGAAVATLICCCMLSVA